MEIRKRKPFSDITNAFDLIPTSTLRKLVSSSGSNSRLALKPPISILKPDYGFRGQKVCPDPSPTLNARSDTSIGSSVNNARAVNSRTVRFQSREMGNKDIVYNGRQTTNEFKNERKTSAMTDNSSTPLAKKKDKRMAIARQVSFSSPRRIGKPCSSLENTVENVMENLSLFSGSFNKVKGFRKGIINPSSCSHEKTENKNANLMYSGCSKN
ncbi:uncharacterized protein LOC142548744 isoform X2 [Primulina tabacum]|uniref:uncharacterized protein LOC142548744 isoform X2 n=1 Tax=Primulina tabacum TaxID=48773 RepID=UPI003F59D9FF